MDPLAEDVQVEPGAGGLEVARRAVDDEGDVAADRDAGDTHGHVDADRGLHPGRRDDQRRRAVLGDRRGRRTAAEDEGEVASVDGEDRASGGVGAAGDGEVAGQRLAEHGELEAGADDPDGRPGVDRQRRGDARHGEGLGDVAAGRVQLGRQGSRDRDTGYGERHRARDGGGQPGAGQQDQGGALAQPQDAGEVEGDVGGGHLDDRGGRRGRDLLEREVAGEHLAGHGEAEAGRLEAQVGAAGQAECRRGRGVDGQPERPGGGDPGGQHERDLAGDPAGQTGRADDQRAGAVGQRDAVPVRHQLEADPAEDDGGRGRRALHGDVGGDRLAEDGQGDGGAVETEEGPGGEVEAGGRGPDREALVHRGRAGVQRQRDAGAEGDAGDVQRQVAGDPTGHAGRPEEQEALAVAQAGRPEVEGDPGEAEDGVAPGRPVDRDVGGERLPEDPDGRGRHGDRVDPGGEVDLDRVGRAALERRGAVHGGAGVVPANGDGAAQGDAVHTDEGDGAGGGDGVRRGRAGHLDDADRGVADQYAGGQRVEAAVGEERRAAADEDPQALAGEGAAAGAAALRGQRALDAEEAADVEGGVGDRDVEDGGGARVRELHRDRAAAHLELLVDRDVAGVHADEHLAAGGDAREGAVQLGVEDAGQSPGAAGRREHEAAGAVGQRSRSGRDGDVGEREPGHGAATVQGEVAGEAVAVDAQHGADDLDAGAAPVEGEGDAGRVGGGAEGGGVELRAAERDPAGGAGRGRGQRAGGAHDDEHAVDVQEVVAAGPGVLGQRDGQRADPGGVVRRGQAEVGPQGEAAGEQRGAGNRDAGGPAGDRHAGAGRAHGQPRDVQRRGAGQGQAGERPAGEHDRGTGVVEGEHPVAEVEGRVRDGDRRRRAGRRDHQVSGEVLAGHVDLQPGAGEGQRAGARVGGGVEVDGEGAAQRDVRDAHGDVAAEAAGVRRPGGGEAAGAVGERDAGQGERGVVEGDAQADRAGAVEGPGEAEVGVHGEAGDGEVEAADLHGDLACGRVDVDADRRAGGEADAARVRGDLGREAADEAAGAEADGAVAVGDGEQATERGADLGEGQRAADAAVGGDRAADRHPAAEGDPADGEGRVGRGERERRGRRGGVQAQGEDAAVEGGARDRERDGAGQRAGRADPGRPDREGARAAGEGQERRTACPEGGPQVAHRDREPARGEVGDRDVGGEGLAEHAQGQAGGADVTRRRGGEDHGHRAGPDGDGLGDGADGVVADADGAAQGDVLEADEGRGAGDVDGVRRAVADESDGRVGDDHAAGDRVALAVGQRQRSVAEEHGQAGAAEVVAAGGVVVRPADGALDRDRPEVEAPAEREGEDVALVAAEDDVHRGAGRVDGGVDRCVGGVPAHRGGGAADGAGEVARDAGRGDHDRPGAGGQVHPALEGGGEPGDRGVRRPPAVRSTKVPAVMLPSEPRVIVEPTVTDSDIEVVAPVVSKPTVTVVPLTENEPRLTLTAALSVPLRPAGEIVTSKVPELIVAALPKEMLNPLAES